MTSCAIETLPANDLRPSAAFASAILAQQKVQEATDALALLDAIEADPARRAAAVASLPP